MKWLIYRFALPSGDARDFLTALLADAGFDSFEETTDNLLGYIRAGQLQDTELRSILDENNFSDLTYTTEPLAEKNWNEEWEKNFSPIVVAGRVGVRASFHAPLNTPLEMVIEPKMSFGTGHHATTSLMMGMMIDMKLKDKDILDFGSGTGILSILASMLGAKQVTAIDNEEWAYENCIENAKMNGCQNVKAILGDEETRLEGHYDVILANINRNVILKNIAYWKTLMLNQASILVSGIHNADEPMVIQAATEAGFSHILTTRDSGWSAIHFTIASSN